MNTPEWSSIRSLLFVPAGKLDKWDKATASGADLYCLDLEDSVPPAEKDSARAGVYEFLKKNRHAGKRIIVRINSPESDTGVEDISMLCELAENVFGVMVPKLDEAGALKEALNRFAAEGKSPALFPLIETARALENGFEILSVNGVAGAIFGGHDLAMQLGCSKDWDVLAPYRAEFIRSAGGLNLSLIDMPWFGLNDEEGLKKETLDAKRFGFTAKAAIHPAQVSVINGQFTPSKTEVADAHEMIRVFEEAGGHAVAWRGKVLEPPVIHQAKRIVERSRNRS